MDAEGNARPPADHDRAFTDEERAHVLAFADARAADPEQIERSRLKAEALADLVAFLAGTGVRISEARLMRWEHVSPEADYVHIHGTKTEGSRRRLDLPDWLAVRVRDRAARHGRAGLVFPAPAAGDPERPWDASNLNHAVRELLDAAELPWAVSHTFRRTVATRLDRNGAPVRRIADQLGHKDASMTLSVYLGRGFADSKADLASLL